MIHHRVFEVLFFRNFGLVKLKYVVEDFKKFKNIVSTLSDWSIIIDFEID
jgi:hypothetical protein